MEFFVLTKFFPHFGFFEWEVKCGIVYKRLIHKNINIFNTMKMDLKDSNTNWKFIVITLVAGLAVAGWMTSIL